ncbi:hypothetical protein F320042A7_42950 [Blautia producta]
MRKNSLTRKKNSLILIIKIKRKRQRKEEYILQTGKESFGWWEEAQQAEWKMVLEPRTDYRSIGYDGSAHYSAGV